MYLRRDGLVLNSFCPWEIRIFFFIPSTIIDFNDLAADSFDHIFYSIDLLIYFIELLT